MMATFIGAHRERFGVEPICAVLAPHSPDVFAQPLVVPGPRWAAMGIPFPSLELVVPRRGERQHHEVYGVRKVLQAARARGLRRQAPPEFEQAYQDHQAAPAGLAVLT